MTLEGCSVACPVGVAGFGTGVGVAGTGQVGSAAYTDALVSGFTMLPCLTSKASCSALTLEGGSVAYPVVGSIGVGIGNADKGGSVAYPDALDCGLCHSSP